MGITTQDIVNILNELIDCDKEAIEKLLNFRVGCNEVLSNHKTCQVKINDDFTYGVGLLGIINAIVGMNNETICSVWNDENNELINFKEMKE